VVRDRALARLRDRDLTLTRVMENTMTLISIKDLNGRYLLYNQPFADALNLDGRGATEGKPGLEVLLGRDDTWLTRSLGRPGARTMSSPPRARAASRSAQITPSGAG